MISLFLDLDGTLIDLAGDPDSVHVPPYLPKRLDALERKLNGALSLASGRSIATLDHLLTPYQGPAIGVHGIEYREPQGGMRRVPVVPPGPALRRALEGLVRAFAPAFIEDKDVAIAVHFHGGADEMSRLAQALQAACDRLQPGWRCLPGHRVIELKPAGIDKGTGLANMMTLAPFAGTQPVAIGDDVTDLDLFAAARDHGGLAIAVGNRIAGDGDCHLPSPAAVLQFLDLLIAAPRLNDVGTVATLVPTAARTR